MPLPPDSSSRRPLPRRTLLRGLLGGSCALALPLGTARAQQSTVGAGIRFFQIGTGTTGGTYFPIGGIIANAISNPPGSRECERGGSCGVPGLIAVAQATSGAVENVEGIRDRRFESGMVQADIAYASWRGEGAFKAEQPFAELRAIANLYTETIHLVVRADGPIQTVADLKGKRVAVGEKGSGTLVSARVLLQAYGLTEKRIEAEFLNPGTASDRLVEGALDAFFIVGGYPLPAVADLAARLPIRLVPLADERADRAESRLPFFTESLVEAGIYNGVPETRSLGVGAQWLVHDAVPDAIVYGVAKALWHPATLRLLHEGHPRGAAIRPEKALDGLAVPLHSGAERYYREAGYQIPPPPAPPEPPPTKAAGATKQPSR
ncbi:MAG TPA: TAXI family TRAP transporter solute-binding subunit [Azospirillaceae bacterium]|nr:TAXI family TRAP transporter solute-binding subunit [Azospirillaceae bacterium]